MSESHDMPCSSRLATQQPAPFELSFWNASAHFQPKSFTHKSVPRLTGEFRHDVRQVDHSQDLRLGQLGILTQPQKASQDTGFLQFLRLNSLADQGPKRRQPLPSARTL